MKRMKGAYAGHLKYSFQLRPHTAADQAYIGAYQGIGLGYFDFGNRPEVGTPTALYLFQGGSIARFSPRLSLNYEWNFGVSFGWKSYDPAENFNNKIIGSGTNAYLNANLYLNWALSPTFDLTVGATGSHFSNGNTRYPNSGLNTIDCKVGLVYNFNRKADELAKSWQRPLVPAFPRHVSYDLTLFGSWRKKPWTFPEDKYRLPALTRYSVSILHLCTTSDTNSVQVYLWTEYMTEVPISAGNITWMNSIPRPSVNKWHLAFLHAESSSCLILR